MEDSLSNDYYYKTSGISYVISCVLIYLAITASPKSMQNYAVVVVDAAIGDIMLATADALTVTNFVPIGYAFALTFSGVCSYVGDFFCFVCYVFVFMSFYHLALLSLFSFYYRFHTLKFGAMSRAVVIFACLGMWIVISSIMFLVLFGISAPHADTAASLKHLFPDRNYTSFYGVGQEKTNMYASILIAGLLIYCTTLNFLMYILRRKIENLFFSQNTHLSSRTIAMHRQLMRVLTIQSIIPWMLSAALLSFAAHLFYFPNWKFLDYQPYYIIGFVPIFNSSVSIIFIAPYRQRLIEICRIPELLKHLVEPSSAKVHAIPPGSIHGASPSTISRTPTSTQDEILF